MRLASVVKARRVLIPVLLSWAGLSLAINFRSSDPAPAAEEPTAVERTGPALVRAAAHHDASPPLWLMPRAEPDRTFRVRDMRMPPLPPEAAAGMPSADEPAPEPYVPVGAMPSLSTGFEGIGQGFTGPGGTFSVARVPPNAVGDVGPNHYVQLVSNGLAIFNKSGTVLYGPTPIQTLWAGFGAECQASDESVVLYDGISDRWFVATLGNNSATTGPYQQCIAVSQSADPTGAWYRYVFLFPNSIPDSGRFGVWPDGYYAGYNMWSAGYAAFQNGAACAYDRGRMLLGRTASYQCFNAAHSSMVPSDLDGTRLPPQGADNVFLGLGSSSPTIGTYKLHVHWSDPAQSTLTGPQNLTVNAWTNVGCGGPSPTLCVPQPGSTQKLEVLGSRFQHRAGYRNLGGTESLVVNHTVSTGGVATLRWYELRNLSTTPTLFQQGTYAPGDGLWRWVGNPAMDQVGNMALGFSAGNGTVAPSIRYAGRLSSDAAGTMPQAEAILQAGGGAQNGNQGRWGFYNSMTVDPADDCTFWYTNMYFQATGINWNSRIGAFKYPSCPAAVTNDFSVGINPSFNQVLGIGATTTYTVTTQVLSGAAETLTLSATGVPAGVTASFSPATVTTGQSSTLTLTAAPNAPGSNTSFTVTGTAASASHPATATVIVANGFSLSVNPSSENIANGGTATYTVTTAVTSGSAESIALTVSGLPAGVTGSFSPATVTAGGTSTLTLSAVAPAGGSTTFTLTGTAPSATRTANAAVVVTNDFSLALTPASRSLRSGASTTFTVQTGVTSGSAESLALTVSGLPAGVTGSFSPATVTAGGTSTLTLTAAANTPGGSATFQVMGTAPGGVTRTAPGQLTLQNDFTLSVNPGNLSGRNGNSLIYSVETTVSSGSPETITLSISGIPAGITAAFIPATVNAGERTDLWITISGSAPGGTFPFTVTGTSASASHTANSAVTVLNDFSLSISPSSRTIASGTSTTYTVTPTRTSGTAETVTLSVSNLPAGVTGSFSPASVVAGGTSTLTLTAAANAAASGTFMVTGNAPSASRTTVATINIVKDFALSVAPASRSVPSGGSATYTVTTTVTSGAAENVALAITGLPAGFTASFAPATVTAGGTS
ncbi:MAG TPA: hypothetical protein VK447_12575, partial [Myxococcaceae bacterium]|nr:hypothetical protein [Myxococcaceae bacterium]